MKKNYPVTGQERTYDEDVNIFSTTDPKGRITYVNQDFIEISGFDRDELIGKAHNVVRHPDMPPAAFEDLWKTIRSGISWLGIVKNRCKNGDHYWVSAYVSPITKDGEIVEFQSVRRKPAPEEVERAESLYARLMAGKPPFWMRLPEVRFRTKLLFTFTLVMLLTLALPVWKGALDLRTALLSLLLPLPAIALFTVREVSPLCRIFAKARSIFDNPVARYVYTGRHDEAGQVMLAFKYLESEAAAIVGRVSDGAETLLGSSESLDHAVQNNRENIDRQHGDTEMVAAAVTEMSASIQEVAANAGLSAEAANRASEKTHASKQVVHRTMEAIQELAGDVRKASEVISQLHSDSDRISSIVSVISGIAEQTNLLALNAAIEAARAGEQGRGFAVVADEVRTLANRTHDSTSEIQEMIEQLQQGTTQAVSVMEQSLNRAGASVERGREAVVSLDEVTSAISEITDMSVQIAQAVAEQKEVAQEVARSVTNIQQTSERNVEGIQTTESSSRTVVEEANEMMLLARQFWDRRR